jgi:hypothetical protein
VGIDGGVEVAKIADVAENGGIIFGGISLAGKEVGVMFSFFADITFEFWAKGVPAGPAIVMFKGVITEAIFFLERMLTIAAEESFLPFTVS